MSMGDFIAATAVFFVVTGALATVIKMLVETTVSKEIGTLIKTGTLADKDTDDRIHRCERRIYGLELKVLGESDTFGTPKDAKQR